MLRLNTYSILFCLMVLGLFSCEEDPEKTNLRKELEDHIQIYQDPTNSLEIEDILQEEIQEQFRKPEKLNLGVLLTSYWIRIDGIEKLKEKFEYLQILGKRVVIFKCYSVSNGKLSVVENEKWTHINFFDLKKIEGEQFFVHLPKSAMPTLLKVNGFYSKSECLEETKKDSVLFWILTLLMVLSFFISVYSYIKSKRIFFILYLFALSAYFCFLLFDSSIAKYIVHSENIIYFGIFSNWYFTTLMYPLLFHFELKSIKRKHINSFLIYGVLTFVMLTVFFLLQEEMFISLLLVTTLVTYLFIFFLLGFNFKRWAKSRKEIVFVIAATALIYISPIKALQNFGVLEGFLVDLSYQLSVFVELILWSWYIVLIIRENTEEEMNLAASLIQADRKLNAEIAKGRDQERAKLNQYTLEELLPKFERLKISLNQDANLGAKEIEEIIEEIRYLSRLYISPNITQNGLEKEIRRYISLLENLKGVNIYLEYHFENEAGQNEFDRLNFYRVLQEGINNALIHHQADNIHVQFLSFEEILLVNIEDDGQHNEINTTTISEIQNRLSDFEHQIQENPIYGSGNRLEMEIIL